LGTANLEAGAMAMARAEVMREPSQSNEQNHIFTVFFDFFSTVAPGKNVYEIRLMTNHHFAWPFMQPTLLSQKPIAKQKTHK
jgi:hypothetical protein